MSKPLTLIEELGTRVCSDMLAENTPHISKQVVIQRIEQAGPRRLLGRFCMLKEEFPTTLDKDAIYLADEFLPKIGDICISLVDSEFKVTNQRWHIPPNELEVF